MELTPITRKENFLAKAAGDPNALDLDPITREEWFISQIQGGGGGGGAVSSVNGTTPTITPVANTIYECGELTSLTVSTIPNTGDFIIRFTSGATATTTNFPASMKFPEAFAPEANTRYEINVSNGYAIAVGWPTT